MAALIDGGIGLLLAVVGGAIKWLHSIDQRQGREIATLNEEIKQQKLHSEERYARRDDVERDFQKIDTKLDKMMEKIDQLRRA
jgi:chromosome segregation ATPase